MVLGRRHPEAPTRTPGGTLATAAPEASSKTRLQISLPRPHSRAFIPEFSLATLIHFTPLPIPRIVLNQNSTLELEFTLGTLFLTRNVTFEPNSTPITPKSDTMEPSPSPPPHFQVADPKLNSRITTTQDPEPNIRFQNLHFRQCSGAFTAPLGPAQGLHLRTSQAWDPHSSKTLVQNEAQEPSRSAFLF